MKNKSTIGLTVTVAILMTFAYLTVQAFTQSSRKVTNDRKQSNREHAHWNIANLSDSLALLQKSELVFMDENSMMGTYVEVQKGQSFQRIATKDDLYYLNSGTCSAKIGKQNKTFAQGGIIYVKQGSEFIITDAKETLQIVIVSMKLSSNSPKPKWKYFSNSETESGRDSHGNSWNPFIMSSNVILGLYMLPYEIDGDDRLVHEWQELNIVTKGSSKFVMDSGTLDVEEGSIFFVEEGNGHYFEALENDLDILILWEQRNVDHSDH